MVELPKAGKDRRAVVASRRGRLLDCPGTVEH